MILSFGDKATEAIYHGLHSKEARKIPKALWSLVQRKLDLLDAAAVPDDLKVPPGNRLEKLRGDLQGQWSIRVNDQYRIVFSFTNGNASLVRVMDYHR